MSCEVTPLNTLNSSSKTNSGSKSSILFQLTRLVWIVMISFGVFATFQYILPALQKDYPRWDETDPGLYRPTAPNANSLMLTHLLCGVFLMLVGPFQLIPQFRRDHLPMHRWTGRAYIFAVILLTCCILIYVIRYRTSRRMIHEDIGNFVFALAALVAAAMSYYHVRISQQIHLHQLWSWRLFAVIFGAAWYRLYVVPLVLVDLTLGSQCFFNLSFYLIFLPGWIVVEAIYVHDWKPTDRLLLTGRNVLWGLFIVAAVSTWIPGILHVPGLQKVVLNLLDPS